jgi:hypothetical protein
MIHALPLGVGCSPQRSWDWDIQEKVAENRDVGREGRVAGEPDVHFCSLPVFTVSIRLSGIWFAARVLAFAPGVQNITFRYTANLSSILAR